MNKQAYIRMMLKSSGLLGDTLQAVGENISSGAQNAVQGVKDWNQRRKATKVRKQKEQRQREITGGRIRAAERRQKAAEKAEGRKAHAQNLKELSTTATEKAQKRLKDIQFRNYSNKLLDKMFPVRTLSPIERLQSILPNAKESNAELVSKGAPSFSLLERLAKGKDKLKNQVGPLNEYGKLINSGILQSGQKEALDKNIKTYQKFENSGFWHQLMALLRQYWEKFTKGTDQHTERFKALLSGNRAESILSNIGKLSK